MSQKKRTRNARFTIPVSLLILALGILGFWISATLDQPSSKPAPIVGSSSEVEMDSSAKFEDNVDDETSAPKEEACSPPTTIPDLALMEGESLEYAEFGACEWDLILWNAEGEGHYIDPDNPCRPYPDSSEDPNFFYLELIPCEYTLARITEGGGVELVEPSQAALDVWNENSASAAKTPPPSASAADIDSSGVPGEDEPVESDRERGSIPVVIQPPELPPVPVVCPNNRNENLEVYDACRKGFVPPTQIRSLGIIKCVKTYETDPAPFGEVYPGRVPVYLITQGIELVGGNFGDWSSPFTESGPRTATRTTRTYGLGEGPFDDYPYPLRDFRGRISFQSMDDRYLGTIYSAEYAIPDTFPREKNKPGVYGDLRACN